MDFHVYRVGTHPLTVILWHHMTLSPFPGEENIIVVDDGKILLTNSGQCYIGSGCDVWPVHRLMQCWIFNQSTKKMQKLCSWKCNWKYNLLNVCHFIYLQIDESLRDIDGFGYVGKILKHSQIALESYFVGVRYIWMYNSSHNYSWHWTYMLPIWRQFRTQTVDALFEMAADVPGIPHLNIAGSLTSIAIHANLNWWNNACSSLCRGEFVLWDPRLYVPFSTLRGRRCF